MDCKLIVSSLALLTAACASMQNPTPAAKVPDNLKPSASESVVTVAAARGVQIYECKAAKDQAGVFEWSFVAPEAELFDAGGRKIGKHYAGPHWEANDGSRVVGTVKARADAPQTDAIPWLLLAAKSDGAQGSFSRITAVQRVNTVGGVAPKTGCSQSSLGTVVRIPYTADYYLLAEKN
jgi:hypothetical protein